MQPTNTAALISDFGEAYMASHETRYISHTPLSYRPPESDTHTALGPAVDIWSLGCVLWDLFAQRPLFDSWGATEEEVRADQIRVVGEQLPHLLPGRAGGANAQRGTSALPPEWAKSVDEDIQGPRRQEGAELMGDDEVVALVEMLAQMLVLDPRRRVTAAQLVHSRWMSTWGRFLHC